MEIKQIITVLIVSIIAGLVFVPVISGMNVTTYSIDYADPTGSAVTYKGAAISPADEIALPAGCNSFVITNVTDAFDVKIAMSEYGLDFVAHSNIIEIYDMVDPTITYSSFQADTVVISEATNGAVWINEYEMFFDNNHLAWSLTYSATGATATDDLFTVQGCQGTVATSNSLNTTEQTLFTVMGILVVLMIVWFISREFRDKE